MNAFLARMREPSTYAGLAVLFGLFGVQMAPETMTTAIQAASGLAGLAAIALGERGK
jgi:hypothetical protein